MRFSGDLGEEETPVPIPNTAVKLFSGDGTAAERCGRVARCRELFYAAPRLARSGVFMSTNRQFVGYVGFFRFGL